MIQYDTYIQYIYLYTYTYTYTYKLVFSHFSNEHGEKMGGESTAKDPKLQVYCPLGPGFYRPLLGAGANLAN
jgi:hypothetical protein